MLDLFAPGALINTAYPYPGAVDYRVDQIATGMAAAHVTAAVALAQDMSEEFIGDRFEPDELETLFKETALSIYDGEDFDTPEDDSNVTPTEEDYKRLDVEAMAYKIFKPSPPDLVNTSDWGFSDSDNKTGDTTPTFTGSAPPNSHVWLYIGSTEIANGAANGSGVYTLTPENAQSLTGSWDVTVKVAASSTVPLANRSQSSPALVVTHSESKSLANNDAFVAKINDSLTFSGSNTGSSDVAINWTTTPFSFTKSGTGTVAIPDPNNQTVSISDRSIALAYNNENGTTNFNVDTGVAATQVGHTRVANWSVSATLGTGASASNVVFNTTQNLAAISVSGSGANASMATNGSRVLVVDSAAVTSGGKLDLYDNDLILKATSATEVSLYNALYALIDGGFNNGNWTGSGVMSTTASGLPGSYSLGLARNSQFSSAGLSTKTTFSGQLVTTNDILVKFTWRGDLDLNGLVNDTDLTTLNAFYAPGYTGKHWWQGDNDYDGDVDNNDVTYFNANYNPSGTQL
jgi:hypothetical protein